MIRPGARVVDLGCGDGELLTRLAEARGGAGLGVDIDIQNVIDVLDRGHDAFQGDVDAGLAMVPDGAYDYAVLSETLQVVHKPRLVVREMLRVAREGIVSFPNFGNWQHRAYLCWRGRMPKGHALPFEWYETPNIHLFTLRDFRAFCAEDRIRILELVCLQDDVLSRALVRLGLRGAGAGHVLVRITRDHLKGTP
jgi:methionine biosynthesis protein MetW